MSLHDGPTLHGERVLLRPWRADDLEAFALLNADPVVMEHLPAPLTRGESDAFVRERIVRQFERLGYGPWALQLPGAAAFAGFVGLLAHDFEAHFTPCIEVGWRLAREHWGHGYATEAARLALDYGFEQAGLDEIVSFTVPANRRSLAVMDRLGMAYVCAFEHPRLPPGHPLRGHHLYRLAAPQRVNVV